MTRLFDAGQEQKQLTEREQRAQDARRRAEEFDKAMAEQGLDLAADELGKQLAAAAAPVQAIRYTQFRKPGSKWMIEHAKVGTDYTFQLFPLRPIPVQWQDAIGLMIAAMDVIFPRSLQIKYTPPDEMYQVKFFTIKIENVVGLPGWEEACTERALNGLAAIDVWS